MAWSQLNGSNPSLEPPILRSPRAGCGFLAKHGDGAGLLRLEQKPERQQKRAEGSSASQYSASGNQQRVRIGSRLCSCTAGLAKPLDSECAQDFVM